MAERKIVQITLDPSTADFACVLYALCSDGTLWRRQDLPDKRWYKLLPIPQETDHDTSR